MAIWLWNSLRQSFSSVKKMKDYCHSLGLWAANVISVKSVCVLQDASFSSFLPQLPEPQRVFSLPRRCGAFVQWSWPRVTEIDGVWRCCERRRANVFTKAMLWSGPILVKTCRERTKKKKKKKRNFKWNLLLGRFRYSDQLDWQYKGGTDWLFKKFKVPAD